MCQLLFEWLSNHQALFLDLYVGCSKHDSPFFMLQMSSYVVFLWNDEAHFWHDQAHLWND